MYSTKKNFLAYGAWEISVYKKKLWFGLSIWNHRTWRKTYRGHSTVTQDELNGAVADQAECDAKTDITFQRKTKFNRQSNHQVETPEMARYVEEKEEKK